MDLNTIERIFAQTAYVRTGGSEEELKTAEYIQKECAAFGAQAQLEEFPVDMAKISLAQLTVDGKDIPCKGYLCAGNADLEAPLYYLRDSSPASLLECKGKIVLLDGYLGAWKYRDICKHGALGFITYDGNANYPDRDIDQRELRTYITEGTVLPGVNINAKDAIELIRTGAAQAHIRLAQEQWTGASHNVILDLPGTRDQWIVLTAHYDSTSLSQGAYDNMSGCVGLIAMAEHFMTAPHGYGLRFIWCGSEERGLLGAKAYCAAHEDALKDIVLNINLDMIGCIMGNFIACCTTEEALVNYLSYISLEKGFGVKPYQDVYSSDSTPFADNGIPAVSFARIAPPNTATIHNSYDTQALMSARQMFEDITFIQFFTQRMANAAVCPVKKEIPENIREKLDEYLLRKRPKEK